MVSVSSSTMWVSRRVRVAALSSTTTDNTSRSCPKARDIRWADTSNIARNFPKQQQEVPWLKNLDLLETEKVRNLVSKKLHSVYSFELAEKLMGEFNENVLWNKCSTIHQLCALETKADILTVLRTYLFVSKKSVHLFSALSRTIIAHQHDYTAAELGEVMNVFAQLGFLDEAFCAQLANRVMIDLNRYTDPVTIVNLFDAYASTRCFIESVVETLCQHSSAVLLQGTPSQLALLASSMARLNVKDDALCEDIAQRWLVLAQQSELEKSENAKQEESDAGVIGCSNSRDITLMAYSFAKMQGNSTLLELQDRVCELALTHIRDFTAKELQMLSTALSKWNRTDENLWEAISVQADRRIAQFSSESLVAFLKTLSPPSLLQRVVCELPRLGHSLKPGEIADFFGIFKNKSILALDVLAPLAVANSGLFGPTEWVKILTTNPPSPVFDAFTMINAVRPNYRNTGLPVSSTVLERMNWQQLTQLTELTHIQSAVLAQVSTRTPSPAEAADMYCHLVALNLDQNYERLMHKLITIAKSTK